MESEGRKINQKKTFQITLFVCFWKFKQYEELMRSNKEKRNPHDNEENFKRAQVAH